MSRLDLTKLTVDASVAVKLFCAEALSDRAEALFARLSNPQVRYFVPDLFDIECANIFWKYARRNQMTPADARRNMLLLRGLPLIRVNTREVIDSALQLALQNDISVYDACYVATAQLNGAALVTADSRLAQKLNRLKKTIVLLEDIEESWNEFL